MERFHKAHNLSRNNRILIESSVGHDVGCFHCLKIFPSVCVRDYIREKDGGETAVCPECDIDSVLPSPVDKEFLEEMRRYWFTYAYGEDKV